MKILLTGRNGQLGFELQRSLAPLGELVAVGRRQCDFSDASAIRRMVTEIRPAVIVNAAAYTAVDKAETEQHAAHAINTVAPGVLGEEAARLGALVVHYSTDYVFDGRQSEPYSETDQVGPINVYGKTKLAGENALLASSAACLVFRTSWVFGAHGENFVRTILRLAEEKDALKVVADQFGTPTSAALLADVTAQVLGQYLHCTDRSRFPFGLYHLAADGVTSWHAYARTVVKAALAAGRSLRLSPDAIAPVTTADYPLLALRPASSRLDTRRLQTEFGLCMPPWQHGLDHVLQQLL